MIFMTTGGLFAFNDVYICPVIFNQLTSLGKLSDKLNASNAQHKNPSRRKKEKKDVL